MKLTLVSVSYFLTFQMTQAIWPPSYEVDLKYEEEFVISEMLQPSDVEDVYDEEEMLHMNEEQELKIKSDSEKFFNIHQFATNENNRVKKDIGINQADTGNNSMNGTMLFVKPNETNPDAEEPIPHEAGFVDSNKQFVNGSEILNSDDNVIVTNEKKEDNMENYDYKSLKSEFEQEIKVAEKANDTLEYKQVKEDESPKEAVKTLVDFQPRKNCTKEVLKGIGMEAVDCMWQELKRPKLQKDKVNILEKMIRIAIIWVIIYIIIAVPLYGWCCCCCRCKWCQPREMIDEAKHFYATNPVGVYYDVENGETFNYRPTNYEKYAQKNLGAAIARL